MVNKNDLTDEQRAVLFIVDKLSKRFAIDKLYVQKMVFLMSKIVPDSVEIYDYEPNNMGMYSPDVDLILEREQSLGVLEGLNPTKLGNEIVSEISKEDKIKKLDTVFKEISDLNKNDIVYLLYHLYPNLTTNSTIKEKVDSYNLQSLTLDLTKLKEGKETEIKTDKGNLITIKRVKDKIHILKYEEGN